MRLFDHARGDVGAGEILRGEGAMTQSSLAISYLRVFVL